ncbi:MAG: hypothetical protein ACREP9_01865 [Candidatus Dormibacteraceae bacterium]
MPRQQHYYGFNHAHFLTASTCHQRHYWEHQRSASVILCRFVPVRIALSGATRLSVNFATDLSI